MNGIKPETLSRIDRYFAAQRREHPQEDTEIRREEPEEWGTDHPHWPFHTDDRPSITHDDPYEEETILGGDGR